jgi:hypothetical protein
MTESVDIPALGTSLVDPIRRALSHLNPSPRVEPNETISLDQVFMPESHRAVLDLGRQIVVGNRGSGKSFWTHALVDNQVRAQAATKYNQPALNRADVVIGFNGSSASLSNVAPTRDDLKRLLKADTNADDIWRAVIFRAVRRVSGQPEDIRFETSLEKLNADPHLYAEALSMVDQNFTNSRRTLLLLFDALDRLADDWSGIRDLTKSLLRSALDLRSFRSFRAKIFMRPDQFADRSLFGFPDASKLRNDHVELEWTPLELYGLLFFEIYRDSKARKAIEIVGNQTGTTAVLPAPANGRRVATPVDQEELIAALAGRYMGTDHRKGRVYTWVPLHLSDAHNTCSPRSFLTAWRSAAENNPPARGRVVNHLGLIDGVRKASSVRLDELLEDYGWIDVPLGALKGRLVPIERDELIDVWDTQQVCRRVDWASREGRLAPVELDVDRNSSSALLQALETIAVMEVRPNGKINVPDIFRVNAGIKRKGGVAVPKRGATRN